jgi:hypothetical protein
MIRNYVAYYNAVQKAIDSGDMTYTQVRDATTELTYALSQQKFHVSSPLFPLALSVDVDADTHALSCSICSRRRREKTSSPASSTSSREISRTSSESVRLSSSPSRLPYVMT